MTRRDDIRDAVSAKLRQELGEVSGIGSELTEVLHFGGAVDGRSVTVVVTKYPQGENPGAYQGSAGWTVDITGEEGRPLHRHYNPEPSLSEALSTINWETVRSAFRGE